MRIGYACLTLGVPDTQLRTCVMKNADESRLMEIIASNLRSLERILDYNADQGIRLFRISSDLIPFGSSPVNSLEWWMLFEEQFLQLGDKIRKNGIRVSMHPGQYTVINSPDEEVVARAFKDLEYHARVLDSLRTGPDSKIILHIGGVYGDKQSAIDRFILNYHRLDTCVKKRLVIENDDKSYNISEVLSIGRQLGIPVIFDNLHNIANPSDIPSTESDWVNECHLTWGEKDGPQKLHYSQQEPGKKTGSHSGSIMISEFLAFINRINRTDIDIMLEVKDKNLSAVKCIHATASDKRILALEEEWSRYKYSVLEKSHSAYNSIRSLLKDKSEYPAVEFYKLLEAALSEQETVGNGVNAAMHVWGYFKDVATEAEKKRFLSNLEAYQNGKQSLASVKSYLKRLADKYQRDYLKASYYFII